MTVSELIRPGDKIDIRLIQQIEQSTVDGTVPKVYKSQMLDFKANGNLLISMPSEGGKLILLPLEVRFEFVFYSMGGLYRGIGQIKERYKKENIYMLEVELKSQLEKFQRREFYRHSCLLDVNYYVLSAEEAKISSPEKILGQLRGDGLYERQERGIIVDLSGGGIRFKSGEERKAGEYLLMELKLSSESLDKQYYIVGTVINCTRLEHISEKTYESRVKFLIKDDRIREEIIRYIFEEERRTRQREKG